MSITPISSAIAPAVRRRSGCSAYVESLSQRTRHELGGVRDRVAVLAESELGGAARAVGRQT